MHRSLVFSWGWYGRGIRDREERSGAGIASKQSLTTAICNPLCELYLVQFSLYPVNTVIRLS